MKHDSTLVARHVETGRIVASRVTIASRRVDRAVGLLNRSSLEIGDALWITPCRGVHTCFMRFAIDVLALDEDGVIVDAVSMLRPWRMRLPRRGAWSVLELPAGTLLGAGARIGHRIRIQPWNASFIPLPDEQPA